MKNGKINNKNREGFTLVEVLIVMAIVAMLSSLAVNGYLSYRKNTLLDLSADNLVAQIEEMRSKTIYGTGGVGKFEEVKAKLTGTIAAGESSSPVGVDESNSANANNSAKCSGVYFGRIDGGFDIKGFEQNFNNKKVWDRILQKWRYQGCDEFNPSVADLALVGDSQVKILSITHKTDTDEVPLNSLVMRFSPPNGVLEISISDGQTFEKKFGKSDLIKIALQYGTDDNLQYQREIDFKLN